ncbi:MAG: hypothetical protein AOA65_1457 [Candidatus Bathyarchaeota archaeon BA1]|nr:MAG: hypothetical protein AOA65_1457 [Candidatus Bathyarchaeota archaeon BA1]
MKSKPSLCLCYGQMADAIVKTHICSEKCLRKYFEPIGGVKIVEKKLKNEGWLD